MKYKLIVVGLLATGMLVTSTSFAKSCNTYIEKLAQQARHVNLKNLHVAEINKQLGSAKPTSVNQKQYRWNDFMVLVRNGRIVKVYGKIPPIYRNALVEPTLEETVMLLGKPKEGPRQHLLRYYWYCKGYGSILIAYTTKQGKVLSYDGLLCKNNIRNCHDFDTVDFNLTAFER